MESDLMLNFRETCITPQKFLRALRATFSDKLTFMQEASI